MPQSDPPRSKRVVKFIRDLVIVLVAAVLISFLLKTFLVRSFYIPSASMEETLQVGDRILVNQLEPAITPISRGDVVVFRDPDHWLIAQPQAESDWWSSSVGAVLAFIGLAPQDSDDHLIKRVIGLPGDRVVCCNQFGQITVNDVPLEEPYITLPDGVTKAKNDDFDVTVPADSLWVLGDNRYNSEDSAAHRDEPTGGFVPIANVVGRAVVVTWPIEHWAWLDDYPVTFAGVPTP